MKSLLMFKRIMLAALLLAYTMGMSAVTSAYYSNLDGKSGTTLFSALTTVSATGYSTHTYDDLWTYFQTTDKKADGKVWDMYSNCSFTFGTNQDKGSGDTECQFYNREHSIPNSWFGAAGTDEYNDLFHLVPTDKIVNGKRSNYPFGEVTSPTYTSGNGSKLGPNDPAKVAGYTGTVFEPIDEYKGDFARGYMGMVVRYAGGSRTFTVTTDGQAIFKEDFTSSGGYGLTTFGINLLMKWHRQDPVSQKEIDRNNGIQATQGNRNPFIDYPCLAEYLWGNSKDATVTLSSLCGSFETGFVVSSSTGCTSCSSGSIPTVTSPTYNEGSAGGNITSLGDPATITENGIYYSTTSGFANGAGTKLAASTTATTTGTFTVNISSLTTPGTYYFKAYATNSTGTSYSAQSSFTIIDPAQVGLGPNLVMGTLVTNDIAFGSADSKELFIRISNVTGDVTLTLSNDTGGGYKFSGGNSTITLTAAEATAGKKVTLTRNGGNNSATLTISGNNITQSHTISGN